MNLDLSAFNLLHNLAGQSVLLDWLAFFFAEYLPYLLVIGVVLILIFEKEWRIRFNHLVLITLTLILSKGIISTLIHFIFPRQRPFVTLGFEPLFSHAADAALPSGHATVFFSLAFALFFINKKWGWWYLAAACVVGLARVFSGVHWPGDILAGVLVSLFSALVVKWVLAKTIRG